MNLARALGRVLLTGAAFGTVPAAPAFAQVAPASYEVKKGEGLFGIAGRLGHPGVTRFQMTVGIYRANRDVFPGDNINVLREGQVLRIPGREEVAAIAAAEASRQYQALTAKPAPAPAALAAVKPDTPSVAAPVRPGAAVPPGAEGAAKRYRDGVALERRGDLQGAFTAYLEAGEAGHGLAQRRLGQIYDKGNTVVQRDYQAALKWYQKAREQGIEMDKPLQRTMPR